MKESTSDLFGSGLVLLAAAGFLAGVAWFAFQGPVEGSLTVGVFGAMLDFILSAIALGATALSIVLAVIGVICFGAVARRIVRRPRLIYVPLVLLAMFVPILVYFLVSTGAD